MPPVGSDAIQLENVWKIFGDRSEEAMQAVRSQDLSKPEVLERFGCAVGVADATFSVREGEIFCVMGLSGSGKSTLVRHINRLLAPSAGRILVHGEDVSLKSEPELRRLRSERMGMVFQHFGLMPHRTVRDNVAQPLEVRGIGKRKRWEEAERVLDLVQLTGWEDRFAHELSGGMQQRVGLGRALAANPDILLMDEPFSALDPLIRRQLQDEFMELASVMRKTTVFITHDLDEAIRVGHRIAIMKDGRADKIQVTLEQRREQWSEALAAGSDNAAALESIVQSLEKAVQDSRDAGAAAERRAGWLIATGIALLLLFKAVQGSVANWALEQRFTRWRSDRGLRTGLDPPAALAAVAFVGVSYAATVTQFTVSQPIAFLDVFPTEKSYQVNLARDIKQWFGELAIRGEHLFDFVTLGLRSVLNALEVLFVGTPWMVIMGIVILLARRTTGARMAIFALAALAYLGVLGFWEKAMTTIALLGTAACISITLGIPVGIVCARSQRAYAVVRPVLDLMQTMPAFVYLIPVIAFFGSGKPAGIIATMIFGSPPVVRLTVLGLRGVPESVREAAMAFGASTRYLLFKVDLPLAAPTIMAGVNQTIMLSLSMVVISSLIGARGLGEEVLEALQFAAEGKGILSGIAILFCAIILDRSVQGRRR